MTMRRRARIGRLEQALRDAAEYGNRMRAERDRAVDAAVALENKLAELQDKNKVLRQMTDLTIGKLQDVHLTVMDLENKMWLMRAGQAEGGDGG